MCIQRPGGLAGAVERYADQWNAGATITPYAASILREYGFEKFAAPTWQQTTEVLVQASDILVFMEREHYDFCTVWIDAKRHQCRIWAIPDVGPLLDTPGLNAEVKRTFAVIRQQTDALLKELGFLREQRDATAVGRRN